GRIVVGGVDLSHEPEHAKRRLGYVPDEPFTYERMTGREFLLLVGELWGVARDVSARRMAELATTFRVEEILDSHAETYSRGNRQKLALIAALLHAPGLLVIDEPIVGLDPESAVRTRDLLRAHAAAGGRGLLRCPPVTFAR